MRLYQLMFPFTKGPLVIKQQHDNSNQSKLRWLVGQRRGTLVFHGSPQFAVIEGDSHYLSALIVIDPFVSLSAKTKIRQIWVLHFLLFSDCKRQRARGCRKDLTDSTW